MPTSRNPIRPASLSTSPEASDSVGTEETQSIKRRIDRVAEVCRESIGEAHEVIGGLARSLARVEEKIDFIVLDTRAISLRIGVLEADRIESARQVAELARASSPGIDTVRGLVSSETTSRINAEKLAAVQKLADELAESKRYWVRWAVGGAVAAVVATIGGVVTFLLGKAW